MTNDDQTHEHDNADEEQSLEAQESRESEVFKKPLEVPLEEMFEHPSTVTDDESETRFVLRHLPIPIGFAVWLVVLLGAWFIYGTSKLMALVVVTACSLLIGLTVNRMVREPQELVEARLDAFYAAPVDFPRSLRKIQLEGEVLYLQFRHHWMKAWVWWILVCAWIVVGIISLFRHPSTDLPGPFTVAGVLALLWLVVAGGLTAALYDSFHDRYLVTSRRLLAERGIIYRDLPSMPSKKLTDITVRTGPLARVLAWFRVIDSPYGTLVFENAGEGEGIKQIDYVPNVLLIYKQITELALEPAPNLDREEKESDIDN